MVMRVIVKMVDYDDDFDDVRAPADALLLTRCCCARAVPPAGPGDAAAVSVPARAGGHPKFVWRLVSALVRCVRADVAARTVLSNSLTTELSTSTRRNFERVTFIDTPGLVDGHMKCAAGAVCAVARQCARFLLFCVVAAACSLANTCGTRFLVAVACGALARSSSILSLLS